MPKTCYISASDIAGTLQESQALVFGASWILYDNWHEFNQKFAELRFKNCCWNEFKFENCNARYLDYYKQIIELFFDTKGLHFSGMIVEKAKLQKQVSVDRRVSLQQLKNPDQIHSWHVYMHLSRLAFDYCQDQGYLTLLYDTGELKKSEPLTTNKIRKHLYWQYVTSSTKKKLTIQCSHQITSHSLYLMQVCDILAGAIHSKWRRMHNQLETKDTAKDQLVDFIEEQLEVRYPYTNSRLHERSTWGHLKVKRWPFEPRETTYQDFD